MSSLLLGIDIGTYSTKGVLVDPDGTINDPNARGVITELTLSHTRSDVFRAVLESVALGIRHNIEAFNQMGADVKRIVAVGGGVQTDTWLQIVSDVTGVSQVVPEKTIGASYVDAFLAWLANGLLKMTDLDSWVSIKKVIEPDQALASVYDGLYEQNSKLYENSKDVLHFLAGVNK